MELCFASLVWFVLQCLTVGVLGFECAPASKTFTIKTSQDVSDITKCGTFTGNIVVAADGPGEVILDGITLVSGNIDVEGVANLHSLSSTSLQAVSSLTLNSLPKLSTLAFPSLRNFSSLKWSNLPSLEESTVATGALEGEIQEITIVNTSLKSLAWLKWPIGSQLNITSNANLKTFSIPYNTINAGSALTLSDNAALETVDLSSLAGIYGGLEISENKKTSQITFKNLETIGGFVQMSGGFTNISMPALNSINGALRVESTGDISSLCDALEKKRLTGHYDCITDTQSQKITPTAPGESLTPDATSTSVPESTRPPSKPASGISNGVKIGLAVAAVALTVLILAFAFFYFRRKRSMAKVREISDARGQKEESVELSGQPTPIQPSPTELESPSPWAHNVSALSLELPATVPHELDARHGTSELSVPASPAVSHMSERSNTPLFRYELPG